MKKILLFVFVVLNLSVFGQTIPGYTYIGAKYRWMGGIFDTALHTPRYNGVPVGVRVGAYQASGAIAVDTSNHRLYFYSGGSWRYSTASTGGGSSWFLTGNSGTTAGTNFLGTTDSVDLVFKTAGTQIARFPGATSSLRMFYFGISAGSGNTATNVNAMGYQAGMNNTGVAFNGFGQGAGKGNTGEDFNGFGADAGKNNTGRGFNGLGVSAGDANTGNYVNAMGENALVGNTGSNVNAFGNSAGYYLGASNTFSNVTLFGQYATASAAGQLVFNNATANARLGFGSVSADRLYTFQNASGTVAFTSDIPTSVQSLAAIGSSPNANGATISGTTLNLEPASASFGGVVNTTTQSFAGAKTFTNATTTLTNTTFNDNGSRMLISPPGGELELYTAGQTNNFTIRNSNATDYITFDAENRIMSTLSSLNIIGGNAATSSLTLQSTSGTGTTGADISFKVGTNGGTVPMTIKNAGNIGIGTSSPNASTLIDISSTTQGVRFPTLNTTQQNAISSPATGLLIWNSDSLALCMYNGTAWLKVSQGGGGGIGGSTGSTDNSILRADGTGGSTLQGTTTAATLADDGTGTFSAVTIGTYGGAKGITAGATDFYFVNGSTQNFYFVTGSQGLNVTSDAGVTTTLKAVYGGNSASFKMGSNLSIYPSTGNAGIGAGGTENIMTVSTTAITATKPVILQGYTVATLPAGTVGMTAYVTDALGPTFLVAIVGGGAVKCPVFYDGTNWVAY